MFENPRRGRQARDFTTNVPKILVLKSSSEQIFSRKLPLGAPVPLLISASFMLTNGDPTKLRVRLWENPNPGVQIQQRFCVFWADSKTDDESIKSTLWMDSSDHTVKIRIFEITDLRGLFLWGQWVGKDLKKVFMTSVFPNIYDKRFTVHV